MAITIVKSDVKLKLKLSSSLGDPSVKLLDDVKVTVSSVTVSIGGGSYQVILPASETSASQKWFVRNFFFTPDCCYHLKNISILGYLFQNSHPFVNINYLTQLNLAAFIKYLFACTKQTSSPVVWRIATDHTKMQCKTEISLQKERIMIVDV